MNDVSNKPNADPVTGKRTATVYRMVMDKHICPWGLKTVHLLKSQGYEVDDRWLKTRAETDAFKQEHGVKTTPQTFIGGERVGGYDDLRRVLGKTVKAPNATTYKPVIAIFSMGGALALAVSSLMGGALLSVMSAELFISITMCLLALQKLQDVEGFATMFLGYDLLAQRWVPYAYLYPFAEGLAGLLMTAHALNWLSVPIALLIGGIGAISVFFAVYVQKRELKCACVGGSSNVPLGFVSLTENVMMVAMGVWMIVA